MADGVREKRGRHRGPRRRGLQAAGALILLLAAAGGGAWYFRFGGKAAMAGQPSLAPTLVSVAPFVVTLRDDNQDMHFVQLGLDLHVDNPDAAKEVTSILPEVKDAIRIEILKHGMSEITTPDGVGHLRTALTDTINGTIKTVLHPSENGPPQPIPAVKDLYFSELVVE